jgi:hypothetical protein
MILNTLSKRLNHLKYDALISTLVCILNNKWSEDDFYYLKTLLLNTLHYLGCNKSEEFQSSFLKLLQDIENRSIILKNLTPLSQLISHSLRLKYVEPSFTL